MRTVVAIYTGQGLADPLKAVFNQLLPDCRLVNIIDDSLIADVIGANKVTAPVSRRLLGYYQQAVDIGADVILNTCSSVGDVADQAGPLFDIPVVRIDEAMAIEAVSKYRKIGVIATLPTTLEPTKKLLAACAARLGKQIEIVEGLAEGAYLALVGGEPHRHDEMILNAALSLATKVDAIVLAQGSMARMEKSLHEKTGIPVLSSPFYGILSVKKILDGIQ